MTAITGAGAPSVTDRRARRRARELTGQAGWTVLGWVVGIAFFIPVLWMVLTAFKPESAAETWPPQFTFSPTLGEFRLVFSGMGPFIEHSAIATVGSTSLIDRGALNWRRTGLRLTSLGSSISWSSFRVVDGPSAV